MAATLRRLRGRRPVCWRMKRWRETSHSSAQTNTVTGTRDWIVHWWERSGSVWRNTSSSALSLRSEPIISPLSSLSETTSDSLTSLSDQTRPHLNLKGGAEPSHQTSQPFKPSSPGPDQEPQHHKLWSSKWNVLLRKKNVKRSKNPTSVIRFLLHTFEKLWFWFFVKKKKKNRSVRKVLGAARNSLQWTAINETYSFFFCFFKGIDWDPLCWTSEMLHQDSEQEPALRDGAESWGHTGNCTPPSHFYSSFPLCPPPKLQISCRLYRNVFKCSCLRANS